MGDRETIINEVHTVSIRWEAPYVARVGPPRHVEVHTVSVNGGEPCGSVGYDPVKGKWWASLYIKGEQQLAGPHECAYARESDAKDLVESVIKLNLGGELWKLCR